MKVIVLGAGVIGITTAYYLNKIGYEVEVYDSASGPGQGTSYANAGQISVAYSAPWAAPGIPLKAIKWMFDENGPLKMHPRALKDYKWLYQFLKNCNKDSYIENKDTMIQLSRYSRECLKELREKTNIQYEGRQGGTLQLFRNEIQAVNASKDLKILGVNGLNFEMICDRSQLQRYEPGLSHTDELVGGLYMPGDETGDCNMFCINLAKICEDNGVKFFYKSNINKIIVGQYSAKCVEINNEMKFADDYVVALGAWSKQLLKDIIDIPVLPVRGHSMTFDIVNEKNAPISTVLDETYKVAITRFDNRVRAGGFAEVRLPVDFRYNVIANTHGSGILHNAARSHQLEMLVHELFPKSIKGSNYRDPESIKGSWQGYRPMTPNGIPIIGETSFDNLYINTGHGTLGWTMACGSGKMMADIVGGFDTDISKTPYKVKR
jgi:D-amino-acid dehydrogenase